MSQDAGCQVTAWTRALSLYHQSVSTALQADVASWLQSSAWALAKHALSFLLLLPYIAQVLCCAAMSTCRDRRDGNKLVRSDY